MNKYITDVCHSCDGTRFEKKPFHGVTLECYTCGGTGLVPNDEGLAILELVRLYAKKYYAVTAKSREADTEQSLFGI